MKGLVLSPDSIVEAGRLRLERRERVPRFPEEYTTVNGGRGVEVWCRDQRRRQRLQFRPQRETIHFILQGGLKLFHSSRARQLQQRIWPHRLFGTRRLQIRLLPLKTVTSELQHALLLRKEKRNIPQIDSLLHSLSHYVSSCHVLTFLGIII